MQRVVTAWGDGHPGTSVAVWRIDGARPVVVAQYQPERPTIPASTMKLVTAAGALLELGPRHRYETVLYGGPTTRRNGRVLTGPLYLRGSGDPVLSTRAYANAHLDGLGGHLPRLARHLRSVGIRQVRGPIVADGTIFDLRRTGPKWRPHYWRFAAPLSGLTSNQSHVGDGQSAQSSTPERRTGTRLRSALRGAGIGHRGRVVTGRTPEGGRDPGYTALGRTTSPPLSRILERMNHSSDNHIAETVLKGLAAGERPATSTAAAAKVERRLRESRVLGARDRVVDGSGLSRANTLSAASLARLITAADRDSGWGSALIASLPRGGEGTLVRRFRSPKVKNRVRAKTGFLTGVTSLAGRVVSRGGHRYAFAILIEADNTSGGRRLQDGVVNLLARGVEDPGKEAQSTGPRG